MCKSRVTQLTRHECSKELSPPPLLDRCHAAFKNVHGRAKRQLPIQIKLVLLKWARVNNLHTPHVRIRYARRRRRHFARERGTNSEVSYDEDSRLSRIITRHVGRKSSSILSFLLSPNTHLLQRDLEVSLVNSLRGHLWARGRGGV